MKSPRVVKLVRKAAVKISEACVLDETVEFLNAAESERLNNLTYALLAFERELSAKYRDRE